jgi:hypothetical protein
MRNAPWSAAIPLGLLIALAGVALFVATTRKIPAVRNVVAVPLLVAGLLLALAGWYVPYVTSSSDISAIYGGVFLLPYVAGALGLWIAFLGAVLLFATPRKDLAVAFLLVGLLLFLAGWLLNVLPLVFLY